MRSDNKRLQYEGKKYLSNSSGYFTIIQYINGSKVLIRFEETGYEKWVTITNIKSGMVRDPMLPSVFGVGVFGDMYPSKENGKTVKQYAVWYGILQMAYDEKQKILNPCNIGVTVSEEFKYYTTFYEWCDKQIGFGIDGWVIDKDLLVKGNKQYSKENCVFLPLEINGALTTTKAKRGDYPIGITKRYSVYNVHVTKHNKLLWLGSFKTIEEAFQKYKEEKEKHLKELAEHYKDQLDPRAYKALLSYKVEITD